MDQLELLVEQLQTEADCLGLDGAEQCAVRVNLGDGEAQGAWPPQQLSGYGEQGGAIEADFDAGFGLGIQGHRQLGVRGVENRVGGHEQRAALKRIFHERAHRPAGHQHHRHGKLEPDQALTKRAVGGPLDGVGWASRGGLAGRGGRHRKAHAQRVVGHVAAAVGGGKQVTAVGEARRFKE